MKTINYRAAKTSPNQHYRISIETQISQVVGIAPKNKIIQDALENENPTIVIGDDGIKAWVHHSDLEELFSTIQFYI